MKNFNAKVLSVFTVLIIAAAVFAFEPVILKDSKTGMTVNLYSIPDESNLLFYGNNRVGYNVSVPHKIFTKVVLLPQNEDGMILESKDGKARFRVTGGRMVNEGILKESYDKACKDIGGEQKASYFDLGNDYWQLCWWKGKTFHIRKFVIDTEKNAWGDCEIYYITPKGEGTYDPRAEIIYNAIESFMFAKG